MERHHATSRSDSGCDRQIQAYQEAASRATDLFGDAAGATQATHGLKESFRKTLRQLSSSSPPEDQKSYLQAIIAQVTVAGTGLDTKSVAAAVKKIDKLSWRGVFPYRAEGRECALSLLEKHVASEAPNLPESDEGYAALARCLKVKFDEGLAHDDACLAREATETALREDAAARDAVFTAILEGLADPLASPDDLDQVSGLEARLRRFCADPTQPLPELPDAGKHLRRSTAHGSLPERLDRLLRHALGRAGALEPDVLAAEIVPACADFVADIKARRTPEGQDHSALAPEVDRVRLAAVRRLLGEFCQKRPSGPTAGDALESLGALRDEVDSLQLQLLEDETKLTAERNLCIQRAISDALAPGDPVRKHLDTIVAWSDDPTPATAARARTFVQEHLGQDHLETLQAVLALKSALQGAAARLGDENFRVVAADIHARLEVKKASLSPRDATQVWLALQDASDPRQVAQILRDRFPENWAAALREGQCLLAMHEALQKGAHLALDAQPPERGHGELDKWCDDLVEAQSASFADAMQRWEAWLVAVRQGAPEAQNDVLRPDQRASLLGLVARRLERFAASETSFPRESFAAYADEMKDPAVLALLAGELDTPDSATMKGLRDPSFETNRYALTRAWVTAQLGSRADGLGAGEKGRLLSLLMELASTRQSGVMRDVVGAIKADPGRAPGAAQAVVTSSVVDAVAGFVDRSFELDTETLDLLRGRAADVDWLGKIPAHTTAQRSRKRTPEDLASLMAAECTGVNRSVRDWVIPRAGEAISELEGRLAAIDRALQDFRPDGKKAIGEWSREDISSWRREKSDGCFSNVGEQL